MTSHPHLRLYAASSDAIMRVDLHPDRAPSITTAIEGVGAQCVAVDPADPDRVVAGTFDNGAFLSTDGGQRWKSINGGIPHPRVLSVAISGSDRSGDGGAVFVGTEPSNLYRSRDNGISWETFPALTPLPSAPTWSFPPRPWTSHVRWIEPHPIDPNLMFAGIELGGVMRSIDGGATWEDRKPGSQHDCHALAIHPVAHDRIYEAAGGGIAISTDRGVTWQPADTGMDRHYGWGIAVDPIDPDLWYISAAPSAKYAHSQERDSKAVLYRTRGIKNDAGWEPQSLGISSDGENNVNAIMPYSLRALSGWPNGLIVGMRNGEILLSDDAGDSFQRLSTRLPGIVQLVAS
ncbi:MAG: WD40/YVTN/BNR-like repeat-containing protein [Thermomicrobiales bacterium]